MIARAIRSVTTDQWRAIDRESHSTGTFDYRAAIVLVTVAVGLTIQQYFGGNDRYMEWFPDDGGDYWELWGFAWWTLWRVIGYVVLPVIAILAMPGERLRDYNIAPKGFFRHLWIYALLFLCILPVVVLASRTPEFTATYPFYRKATRSAFDLWTWEAMYGVQFLALEFFFRGFLLQGLRRALGSNAIFVMMVPYCMIHYGTSGADGKPFPETMGAIGAGLILGTLAMRTRSMWGGVVIHVGVALTMDMLALSSLT